MRIVLIGNPIVLIGVPMKSACGVAVKPHVLSVNLLYIDLGMKCSRILKIICRHICGCLDFFHMGNQYPPLLWPTVHPENSGMLQ